MSTATSSSIPPEIQAQIDRLTRKVESLASQIKSNREVPKKEWYRPMEVCQLLGISRSKFESYKRSGFFPIQKLGGGVYVASSDIESLFPNQVR
jgi:predicted DNA-binding transcriptional regulator AlpA